MKKVFILDTSQKKIWNRASFGPLEPHALYLTYKTGFSYTSVFSFLLPTPGNMKIFHALSINRLNAEYSLSIYIHTLHITWEYLDTPPCFPTYLLISSIWSSWFFFFYQRRIWNSITSILRSYLLQYIVHCFQCWWLFKGIN